MLRIIIRHSVNKSVNFLHVINFLVSYKLRSLEEAVGISHKFESGEDAVFDIQDDEIASSFKNWLDHIKCDYECSAA